MMLFVIRIYYVTLIELSGDDKTYEISVTEIPPFLRGITTIPAYTNTTLLFKH